MNSRCCRGRGRSAVSMARAGGGWSCSVRPQILAALTLLAWLGGAAAVQIGNTSEKQLHNALDEEGSELESPFRDMTFDAELELTEDFHATMVSFVDSFEKQQLQQARQRQAMRVVNKSQLLGELIGNPLKNRCGINESSSPARENLVVLPAGDSFDAAKWMDDPVRSNWDIILIYYGKDPYFRCPLCKAVYRASGAKWRLAWGFTLVPEWQEYQKQYRAIMFADDDLDLDMCVVNTVFSIMKAYKLLMAQPSLCREIRSFTPWGALYQQSENILRYTTMIEIMAPTYEMDYFQNFIRPSLYNAYVGWGLDFVWPFLLKYPRDKIAVIDQVCMSHPPSAPNKANSVYSAVAPYRKKEEETRRFAEYGYFASEIEKLGFPYMPVEILGAVPKPKELQDSREQLPTVVCSEVIHSKMEMLFPTLLLLQSTVILVGCLLLLRQRAWGRRKKAGDAEGQLMSCGKNGSSNARCGSFGKLRAGSPDLIPAKF